MRNIYEFEHECEAMPESVRFVKINGSLSSQFTIETRIMKIGALQSTTLYNFRYCPYCGEDMERKAGDES